MSTENKNTLLPREAAEIPSQVDGPYFEPEAPFGTSLVAADDPGETIRLAGDIIYTDGSKPQNPIAHFWCSTSEQKGSRYDNQNDNGDRIPVPKSSLKRHRRQRCKNGRYTLTFTRPGNYSEPQAVQGKRPAHLHYAVEVDGKIVKFGQLYFLDDPYNRLDIQRNGFFKPELIMHLSPAIADGKTVQKGTFNIVLALP